MSKMRKQNHQDETTRNARRLLRFISHKGKKLSPLLLLTHDYPDPDALASAFGLQYLADRFFGISSKIVYGGIIGRRENRGMVSLLKLPVHKLKKSDLKKNRNIVLIDTQPGFENNSFPKKRRATIVVDQHPSAVKPTGDLVIVDVDCGATCVIIGRALLLMKSELPSRVATALAYGILSDTMSFYRSHRPDVIQTYLDLIPYVDMWALARIQNPTRSKAFFKTLSHGIRNAQVRRSLIVSHLGEVESPDLVAQVADFLLSYRRIQYSMATGRYRGRLHVSLRVAKPTLEAGQILRSIFDDPKDAGGHDVIAGGSTKLKPPITLEAWEAQEDLLVDRLLKRLRFARRGDFHLPFRVTTSTEIVRGRS